MARREASRTYLNGGSPLNTILEGGIKKQKLFMQALKPKLSAHPRTDIKKPQIIKFFRNPFCPLLLYHHRLFCHQPDPCMHVPPFLQGAGLTCCCIRCRQPRFSFAGRHSWGAEIGVRGGVSGQGSCQPCSGSKACMAPPPSEPLAFISCQMSLPTWSSSQAAAKAAHAGPSPNHNTGRLPSTHPPREYPALMLCSA